jgi:hypothetical protein
MAHITLRQDSLTKEPLTTTLIHAGKIALLITGYILLSAVFVSLYRG